MIKRKPLDEKTKEKWWEALKGGDKETVKDILVHYIVDIDATHNSIYRVTPLHYAAWNNSKEVAEFLIQHDADVNAKDGEGCTPLHWAAEKNSKELAELLIREGADVNAKRASQQPYGGPRLWPAHEPVRSMRVLSA
ncbi:MAG: ankyrin repeat domain-containing protein, partial [Bacteroidota bacterium]